VLRPDVAAAALEEALRRLRPESHNAERTRLQTALRQIEGQLANLTAAVAAGGGETGTLVQAVKDRERERVRLTCALADVETLARLTTLDFGALQDRPEEKLAAWRGLLGRHPQQARHPHQGPRRTPSVHATVGSRLRRGGLRLRGGGPIGGYPFRRDRPTYNVGDPGGIRTRDLDLERS